MDLSKKDKKELSKIAKDLGLNVDGRASAETLRKEINALNAGAVKPEDVFVKPVFESPLEEKKSDVLLTEQPKPKAHTAQQAPVLNGVDVNEYPDKDTLEKALHAHIARGMHILEVTPDYWHFKRGLKEDTGTMKQPLRQIIKAASRLINEEILPSTTSE